MWAILNYLSSAWKILNLFWNLIFYLSLLRMLFLTSNFVYQSCKQLAALHHREKLTSRAISTASQTPHIKTPHSKTPHSNPNLTPPSLKPLPPSNPAPSQLIIDKYPYQQLKDVKNEFHELREENCDFEETNSWCQCSCVLS